MHATVSAVSLKKGEEKLAIRNPQSKTDKVVQTMWDILKNQALGLSLGAIGTVLNGDVLRYKQVVST
jgi:hypothetical protein